MATAQTVSKQKSRREQELETKLHRLREDNKKQKESLIRKKKRLDDLGAENARLLQQLGKNPVSKSAESDSEEIASAPVSAAPSRGGSPTHASLKSGTPSCVGEGEQFESQLARLNADRKAVAEGFLGLEAWMASVENVQTKWAQELNDLETVRNDLRREISVALSTFRTFKDDNAQLFDKVRRHQTVHELRLAQQQNDLSISVEELRLEASAWRPVEPTLPHEKSCGTESAVANQVLALQGLLHERIRDIASLQEAVKAADATRQQLETELEELRRQNIDLNARLADVDSAAAERERQGADEAESALARLSAENEKQQREIEGLQRALASASAAAHAPGAAISDIAEKEVAAAQPITTPTPAPAPTTMCQPPRGVFIPIGLLIPSALFLLLALVVLLLGPADDLLRTLATGVQNNKLSRPT